MSCLYIYKVQQGTSMAFQTEKQYKYPFDSSNKYGYLRICYR